MTESSGDPEAALPTPAAPPAHAARRAIIAILLPLGAALLVGVLTGSLLRPAAGGGFQPSAAPLFAALGAISLLLGVRWYGLKGLGLRGGRPLFAGIGFSVLAWVAVLIARFLPMLPTVSYNDVGQAVVQITLFIEVIAIRSAGSGRAFFYLLVFEAFATQIWAFGLVFRSLADWRAPLTAATVSGILWGALGFLLFQESFVPHWSAFLYFLLWGVLYGIIRLRTGSLIGMVIVQALQTFTAWFVFQPPAELDIARLQYVYLCAAILFALIIWRLWPRREEDYRV